MTRWSLLSLALHTGCDQLFDLEHVDRSDAGNTTTDAREGCVLDTFSTGMTGFAERWTPDHTPPTSIVAVDSDQLLVKITKDNSPESVFGAAVSKQTYDLTGATISLRVPDVIGSGDAETYFDLDVDFDNYYEFSYSAGMLAMQLGRNSSVSQIKSIPYDPVAHAYWRFQHMPAVAAVVFYTSADGMSWMERHSIATAVHPVNRLFVEIGAGVDSGTVTDSESRFDDFELCLP
jgi:hypothetical protein